MTEPIPTGCGPIDDLLDGGFPRGAVTQIYGPPAAGKTNLALSAAVAVAVGDGTAVYVDTEDLAVARLEQMVRARIGNRVEEGADRTVDDVASRIVVSDANTFEQQREAVRDAEDFAERAELIVLDSATGFYRLERTEQEEGEALRDVARQITHLLSLARRHDLAVAFTNQVYTDPDADRTRALGGHTLDHWSSTILRLDRFRGGRRRATLEKHRSKAAGDAVRFRITDAGLAADEGGP